MPSFRRNDEARDFVGRGDNEQVYTFRFSFAAPEVRGCVIEGDAVGNGTSENIRVILISRDGRQKERVLKKEQAFGERRRSFKDEGFRYSVVRAYHMDGRVIGEVTIGNTKEWRKKYGKYVRIIVLKDNVHPMTHAEFVSYYGK